MKFYDENLLNYLKEIKSLHEKKLHNLIKSVAKALNEIHSHNIVHMDVKPENIMVQKDQFFLTDYGCSIYLDENFDPDLV